MDDRGWGWTESEIRQVQLVEWLVPQSSSVTYVPVGPFYDALQDQGPVTIQLVRDELRDLEQRSLIAVAARIEGIESYSARATAEGRRFTEELQARRADKRLRKIACRDAMVDWLYVQDATSPLRQLPRSQMLSDPRRATWLVAPFSENDLDAAAGWLSRHGLVDGVTSWGAEGPVRLHLTDAGTMCAEDLGSDTARFAASRQPAGPAINRSAGAQVGLGNIQVNYFDGNRTWPP